MPQHFRVARHTSNIEKIREFYTELIGLKVLYEFNHDGYRGIMLGKKSHDWHLEFTVSNKEPNHSFDEDDVLVFYFSEDKKYIEILERFKFAMIDPVKSSNPYWDIHGRTFVDPDGHRVVICHKEWEN